MCSDAKRAGVNFSRGSNSEQANSLVAQENDEQFEGQTCEARARMLIPRTYKSFRVKLGSRFEVTYAL